MVETLLLVLLRLLWSHCEYGIPQITVCSISIIQYFICSYILHSYVRCTKRQEKRVREKNYTHVIGDVHNGIFKEWLILYLIMITFSWTCVRISKRGIRLQAHYLSKDSQNKFIHIFAEKWYQVLIGGNLPKCMYFLKDIFNYTGHLPSPKPKDPLVS